MALNRWGRRSGEGRDEGVKYDTKADLLEPRARREEAQMRDHVSGHPRLVIVSESRPIAYAILGPFLGYGVWGL